MMKTAAIVPAYNEASRISRVLEVLTKIPDLAEIIVIDDGSSDDTFKEAQKFPVRCFRNEKNLGKAATMQRGVDLTDAECLFFCDADLQGLCPEIIERTIEPVASGKTDMFIAVHSYASHRYVKPIGLLSGERALTRKLWNMIPNFYKYRFRIEFGLNRFAEFYGKGFAYKVFENYYITRKEIKYGLRKGFLRRMWMYFDILSAYLFFYLLHVPKTVKLLRRYVAGSLCSLLMFLTGMFFIFTATKKGYFIVMGFIRRLVLEDPDASLSLFVLRHLRDFTIDVSAVLAVVFLSLGAWMLLLSLLKIFWLKRLKV